MERPLSETGFSPPGAAAVLGQLMPHRGEQPRAWWDAGHTRTRTLGSQQYPPGVTMTTVFRQGQILSPWGAEPPWLKTISLKGKKKKKADVSEYQKLLTADSELGVSSCSVSDCGRSTRQASERHSPNNCAPDRLPLAVKREVPRKTILLRLLLKFRYPSSSRT